MRVKLLVVLFLMPCLQVFCAQKADAQDIRFYDSRGREIREGNRFPLDRFSRGETCNVVVSDPYGLFYYVVASTRGIERDLGWQWVYLRDSFRIPLDPNADNVTVLVFDWLTGVWFYRRIPIGSK